MHFCATVLQAVKVLLTDLPERTCECRTLQTLRVDVCVAVAEALVQQLTVYLQHKNDWYSNHRRTLLKELALSKCSLINR